MPQHLLILHGWNHSSKMWQNAYDHLDTNRLTLHIPDLPGFGQKPIVSPDWNIPDYAAWVEQYINKNILNDSRFQFPDARLAVLGHSFGGRIAAYLASQNPPWLQHLVLYAAPVLYRPTNATKRKIAVYKAMRAILGNQLARNIIQHINPELSQADQTGLGQIYRNIVPFDQTQNIPDIQARTDIIIGTHDTEVRQHIAHETHQLIKNSKLHILENQTHNIHLDNPTLFYGLLRKILA